MINENYVAFDKYNPTDPSDPHPPYVGDWYDPNQIQQVRHGWTITNKSGTNPWGGEWHIPESLFRWTQGAVDTYGDTHYMSAPQIPDHETYLCNTEGFSKKTFSSYRPWWTTTVKNEPLTKGKYVLSFTYYDDNFVWDGEKVPPPDPLSFEVRLVAGTQTSPWTPSKFLQLNTVTHEFTLGESAQVGFEMRGRWGISNIGVFAQGFTVEKVDLPKIVIMKTPQNATKPEHLKAAGWAYDNFRRTLTASTDDMLTMLGGGNEESYAVVVDPTNQAEAIAELEANGYDYVTLEWDEL